MILPVSPEICRTEGAARPAGLGVLRLATEAPEPPRDDVLVPARVRAGRERAGIVPREFRVPGWLGDLGAP